MASGLFKAWTVMDTLQGKSRDFSLKDHLFLTVNHTIILRTCYPVINAVCLLLFFPIVCACVCVWHTHVWRSSVFLPLVRIQLGLAGLVSRTFTCCSGLNEKCSPSAGTWTLGLQLVSPLAELVKLLGGVSGPLCSVLLEEARGWGLWVTVFLSQQQKLWSHLLSHLTSPIDLIYFNKELLS